MVLCHWRTERSKIGSPLDDWVVPHRFPKSFFGRLLVTIFESRRCRSTPRDHDSVAEFPHSAIYARTDRSVRAGLSEGHVSCPPAQQTANVFSGRGTASIVPMQWCTGNREADSSDPEQEGRQLATAARAALVMPHIKSTMGLLTPALIVMMTESSEKLAMEGPLHLPKRSVVEPTRCAQETRWPCASCGTSDVTPTRNPC
jgi:hypothetical protein